MLEGLEISVVKFSEIRSKNFDFRIDSEYFKKEYILIENLIKKNNCKDLSELSFKISDGTHFTPNYIENGVKFLSALNVSDNYFDLEAGFKYISQEEHKSLYSRCNPESGDVLLRKVGVGLRKACVVPQNVEEFSIFVSVALIKCKEINPYYLSTYINTSLGQEQLFRFNKGISQPDLHLEDISRLKVPIFPDTFQSKIESIVKSAHAKLEESKSLYSQAEDLLLGELGLKDWRPKNTLHTTKKFSDFAQSGRLDAEYYQPKYDDLFERLQKVDCKTIKEIQIINYRGFQPEYVENGKIDVINSKHILEDGLDYENFEKTDEVSFNNAVRAQVKYGDILTYTTGANIGRTQVYLSEKKAMASNHVNMLRVKDVNPIYLALVLNSKIGRMQTEKSSTGSAQVELYPDDLASFIIPILPEAIQTKIASLIQQSFECKAQSKQLLEDAKRMVEAEIEKN